MYKILVGLILALGVVSSWAQPLNISVLNMAEQSTAPAASLNRIKIYGKEVAGITRPFARLSDGTELDLTDVGVGSFGETSLSSLVGNQTLWDSANATRNLTFGLSGATDPVLSALNNLLGLNVGLNITGPLNVGGAAMFTNNVTVVGTLTVGGVPMELNSLTTNALPQLIVATNAPQFTNAILNSVPGDLIVVPPPGFTVPAMTNWCRPGVNYYIFPGAKIISLGGSEWFTGAYDAVGTTNYIGGAGELVASNNTIMVYQINTNADLTIQCRSMWKDNMAAFNGMIEHSSGKLLVNASEFLRCDGYDIYVASSGDAGLEPGTSNFRVAITADEWIAGDGALECEEFSNPGGAVFSGRLFRKLAADVTPDHKDFIWLTGHATVNANTISLGTNGWIRCYAGTDGTKPVINARYVYSDPGSKMPVTTTDATAGVVFKNSTIVGPSTVDAVFAGASLTLENSTIVGGVNSTNSIRANSAANVMVMGTLNINKPLHANVTVRGLLVSTNTLELPQMATPARPTTNTVGIYSKESGGKSRLYYISDDNTEYGPLDAGGGAGTPGGATTQIQYNNASAFDGASGIVIPASEGETNLNVSGTIRATSLNVTQDVTFTGTGTARLRLNGSTLGFTEFQTPASGQSNSIVLNLANTAPGGVLKIFSNTAAAGTNNVVVTNIGIAPFTNSYVGAVVFVPSDALAKEVQVLVATNDFQLNWTNQVSGKLISLSIYNNGASNITFTHHGGVRFMGGASNVVAAGRELAVAAKFIGTNISLAFAPQTN